MQSIQAETWWRNNAPLPYPEERPVLRSIILVGISWIHKISLRASWCMSYTLLKYGLSCEEPLPKHIGLPWEGRVQRSGQSLTSQRWTSISQVSDFTRWDKNVRIRWGSTLPGALSSAILQIIAAMSAPFPIPEDNQPSSSVRRNGTRLPHGRALHAWLRPWLSASCWYYTSRGPFHPSASSGLHTAREGGFFYLWTRCHHLQTNQRGSCPLGGSTMYSCPKHPAYRAQ